MRVSRPHALVAPPPVHACIAMRSSFPPLLSPNRNHLATPPTKTPALPRSAVGFVAGDLVAQHVAASSAAAHHAAAAAGAAGAAGGLDLARAARLGLYGLALDGPLGAAWYSVLVRYDTVDAVDTL